MKVQIKDRAGNVKVMNDRYARILSKMGRVTYLTRDMQAAPVVPEPVVLPVVVGEITTDAVKPAKRKYTRKAKADE